MGDLNMIEGIYTRAFPISQVQFKASTCAATCLYKSGRLQTQLVNEFHRCKGSRQGSHVTALSKPLHTAQLLPVWGPVGAVSLLLWVCLSLVKLPRLPTWIAIEMNQLKAVPESNTACCVQLPAGRELPGHFWGPGMPVALRPDRLLNIRSFTCWSLCLA